MKAVDVEKYEEPELEVITFDEDDVIVVSGGGACKPNFPCFCDGGQCVRDGIS